MTKLLEDKDEVFEVPPPAEPSTSTTTSFENIEEGLEAYLEEREAEYQAPTITQVFSVSFDVPKETQSWLDSMAETLDKQLFENFNKFLVTHESLIAIRIKRYPKVARNPVVFKDCCEFVSSKICFSGARMSCYHNINSNPPVYSSKHGIYFINPLQPATCQQMSETWHCTDACLMMLPWKFSEVVNYCKRHNYPHEEWMGGRDYNFKTTNFDNIFGNLVKWVWNFYYDKMKPAIRSVMCFFSSFSGFVMGLSLITAVLSTVGLGVAIAVDVKKMTKGSEANYEPYTAPMTRRQPTGYIDYNPSTSRSSNPMLQGKQYDPAKPRVAKVVRPRVPAKPKFESAQQFSVVEKYLVENLVTIVSISKCEVGMKM